MGFNICDALANQLKQKGGGVELNGEELNICLTVFEKKENGFNQGAKKTF